MTTGLRKLRVSMQDVSQEAVARKTTLSLQTYRKVENGNPCKYSSAIEVLGAINEILKEHSKDEVKLDDLGLTLE